MYRYLLLLFFTVPLLEVWLLVRVGSQIGPWWLILSILATAVIGSFFLRLQGFATLRRAQQAMLAGQLPTTELLEGVILLLAGALLLTPGYATDVVGFFMLVPALRKRAARAVLARYLAVGVVGEPDSGPRDNAASGKSAAQHGAGDATAAQQTGSARKRRKSAHVGEVLEGEYTRED
ncbi:MAG: FxsA family protein [Pseudomonadales bacterium]